MYDPDGNKRNVVDILEKVFYIQLGEYRIFLTIPYILENGKHLEHTYMWLNPSPQNKYASSNTNKIGVNVLEIPYL